MKPKQFREVNIVYGADQPEYVPLPAFREKDTKEGIVVTCWGLSFIERLRILFKGEVWLNLMTFNGPLQPTFMSTKKKDVLI